jgi:hypothetical protein
MQKHYIPIWFFIGSLLLLYGVLILGAGIYQIFVPPLQPVVLADLHAGVWWGGLLIVVGAIYIYAFWPGCQSQRS